MSDLILIKVEVKVTRAQVFWNANDFLSSRKQRFATLGILVRVRVKVKNNFQTSRHTFLSHSNQSTTGNLRKTKQLLHLSTSKCNFQR